ncbi:ABC transporter substrate-binding protein [Pseudomonas aeruginosa]
MAASVRRRLATCLPSAATARSDLERLLELQPDLILVWPGSVPEAQLQRLRDFGIALFIAEPHSLDELALQLAALGEALGEAEAGQRLSARFREGMRRLAERYRRDKPLKVFYQVWDRPLLHHWRTPGDQRWPRVCGAENLFGDLPQPAPQVSVEAVLARDPAVIVAGSHAQLELWRQWPALAATRRGLAVPDRRQEPRAAELRHAGGDREALPLARRGALNACRYRALYRPDNAGGVVRPTGYGG